MQYHSKQDHVGRVLAYEKTYTYPEYEYFSSPTSIGATMTKDGEWKYWTVRVCDECNEVWWQEDKPIYKYSNGFVVKSG